MKILLAVSFLATYDWREAFCPSTWANWALVIVGTGATIAALMTLRVIKRQAVSMRRQTTHLRNSVEAAIAENRPWLLIGPDGIQKPYLEAVEENMVERMTHCIFFTKNYGKTPGKIFASKAEMQIGDSPIEPPDASVYDMKGAIHNLITFPPGEAVASQAILAPLGFIKLEDRNRIVNKSKFLWLCGFLRYRDTFERKDAPEHETRFCYLYETRLNSPEPFWILAGSSEFNRAT